MARRRTLIAFLVVMVAAGGCRLKDQPAPSLTGPSGLALSLNLSASPDSVPRDGGSQSVILVQARNASGQPLSNLTVRLAILCQDANAAQQYVDFGSLSASTVVTGADGTATAVYTAPSANSPLNSYCSTWTVWVGGIPVGTNYAAALSRQVQIGLVAPGSTLPPFTLIPAFTVTPASPKQFDAVTFDASTSTPASSIASYSWKFGDGATASGMVVTHAYRGASTFLATLTIKDALGRSTALSTPVTIGASTPPTAAIVASPSEVTAGATINLSGATSTAAAGHSIASYHWEFPGGSLVSGSVNSVSCGVSYPAAGTYTIILTVTDDVGNRGVTSQSITVN